MNLYHGWVSDGGHINYSINIRGLDNLFKKLLDELDKRQIPHSRMILEEEFDAVDPSEDIRNIEKGIRRRLKERYG
jgi:hypothetical protein